MVEAIRDVTDFVTAEPASEEDIAAVHTQSHIERVKRKGLWTISALAAGGAVMAAEIGLSEKAFGLLRSAGHHADFYA